MSDEEEYEEVEVVDVKRIIIIVGLVIFIGVVIFSAAITFEVIPNPIPEFILPEIELPVNEEEIFEELKQNNIERESEISQQDEVLEEILTQNELLIIEFLRFGLTEEEIIGVLIDDCNNYINATAKQPKFESKFELLVTVKSELCFGVPPEDIEIVPEVVEPEPVVEVPEEVIPEIVKPEVPEIINGTMINGTMTP